MKRTRRRVGDPNCSSCRGSGDCLACAGSGLWYSGTLDEDECSSCGGSGKCPNCFAMPAEKRDTSRARRESDVLLLNFSYLVPNTVAGMGFPATPRILMQLVRMGFRTAIALHEPPPPPVPEEFAVHYHPLPDFQRINVGAQHAAVQAIHRGPSKIVVFCYGGYGRTGVVLADYLVSLGQKPTEAIDAIRAARPGSIDHPALEQSVHDYAMYLKTLRSRSQ